MNTQANKNQLKVSGGTTGQALVKLSNADYDYDWGDVSSSISTISLYDDFLVQTKITVVADNVGSPFPIATDAFGSIGQLGWSGFSNTSGGVISTFIGNETNHPGVIQIGTNSQTWISLGFYDSSGGGTTYNAIDDIMRDGSEYIGIVRASSAVSRFIISGSGNVVPYQALPDNSIYVEFDGTDAVFSTSNGATTQSTTVITGYSTSTYYNIKFVVSGSSVKCYVDGTLQATHSTNVPASGTDGNPAFTTVSGTNPAIRVDYFAMNITGITR